MRIHVAHDLQDRELALEVMHVARELGHDVIDPVEGAVASLGFEGIDLFVAIVSPHSVNTYFELGLVAGQKNEVLIVAQHRSDLTPAAAQLPCLVVGDAFYSKHISIERAIERAALQRRVLNPRIDMNIIDERQLRDRVVQWLAEHGATAVETESSGRDIVARMPGGRAIVVEVKALPASSRVSIDSARQLQSYMRAVSGIERGLLVTTGGITRAATEFAASQNIAVVSFETLLESGSLDELFKATRTRVQRIPSEEIGGQVLGYWFGPQEQIPSKPVGSPTGAVLLPAGVASLSSSEVTCLDLVFVDGLWVVLSEFGRHTYTHTSGMSRGERWRFVPVPEPDRPWPTQFGAMIARLIPVAEIGGLYGLVAAERARPDACAVQLSLRRLKQMGITFTRMGSEPDRDASAYLAANVVDTTGTRYPIRLMIDGVTLAAFSAELNELGDDIVENLYRQELEVLLEKGELRPANPSSSVNVVFFTDETKQVRVGDIVIGNALEKLRDTAKRLGKVLR